MGGFSDLFEPEEVFGSLWHRLVGQEGVEKHYGSASIELEDIRQRLEVFFRGVGGDPGVELKAIAPQTTNYRRKFLAKIGDASTAVSQARFDGDCLYLPHEIALFPEKDHNDQLYKWLTVWSACIGTQLPQVQLDPLQNDICNLRFLSQITLQVFEQFPGMKSMFNNLVPLFLAERLQRSLPEQEAQIEAAIVALLSGVAPSEPKEIWRAISDPDYNLDQFTAKAGYHTFLPVALWGEVVEPAERQAIRKGAPEDATADETLDDDPDKITRKAKRQKSDQIDKKDSLIIARFEAILSWSEMMNIPRAVDDDDDDRAQSAADDQEELGIVDIAKKASSKLKFDLDLAPQDVEHERLAARHTYPEWDYRKNAYLPDHCRVLAATAPELEAGSQWQPDHAARRRIRTVKRQFEALRPKPERLLRQVDGNEIDMDALIRARTDMAANGEGSNRVFSSIRNSTRDLSVAVLIDISRSSESWIEGRQVIDISREALMAMTLGLAASGDDNAIYSFSSLRRDRVFVSTLKRFDEKLSQRVFSRIGALKPGFYTRLGAGIRHVTSQLSQTASEKKLLLVLSDGKPNDLDHYEGRYGVEDTAKAVREARRAGCAVFGMTIDKKAQSYFPYIFGRNAFAITNHANDLTKALPRMYQNLVT